ncbi:MAG: TIM barrel protein [Verrucomicrobia bacterium]|nr:TIM barrel protein [Verrucomicrobiota bacterium]
MNRREFIIKTAFALGGAAEGLTAPPGLRGYWKEGKRLPYLVSLCDVSLRRALSRKKVRYLDLPRVVRERFGLEALELSTRFFSERINDPGFFDELAGRAKASSVRLLVLAVDEDLDLTHPHAGKRGKAAARVIRWAEVAKRLHCHSVMVKLGALRAEDPGRELTRVAAILRALAEGVGRCGLNLAVANDGGLSSHGKWMAALIRKVGRPNCGAALDVGNFTIAKGRKYDPYRGASELAPYTKAVRATMRDFDEKGEERSIDYERMMRIVVRARYHGFVGICYVGQRLSEEDGILAGKRLLERVRAKIDREAKKAGK